MHFSIDRTIHTTAFDKPVVDHWFVDGSAAVSIRVTRLKPRGQPKSKGSPKRRGPCNLLVGGGCLGAQRSWNLGAVPWWVTTALV